MRRITTARANWRERAYLEAGFAFHTIGGSPLLGESAYYAFTLRQIEKERHQGTDRGPCTPMALDLVTTDRHASEGTPCASWRSRQRSGT